MKIRAVTGSNTSDVTDLTTHLKIELLLFCLCSAAHDVVHLSLAMLSTLEALL